MRILCIDNNLDFKKKLKTEADRLEIELVFNETVETAAAYLINPECVKVEKGIMGAPIAWIYPDLPEVEELKKIRGDFHHHYVCCHTMGPEEIHYLLMKLSGLEKVLDWISEIPASLMNDYLRLTYEKLAAIATLKQNPTENLWEELQTIVHKIAGSAGLYGRIKASEICKEAERLIRNKEYQNLNLDIFYRQLYLYIQ